MISMTEIAGYLFVAYATGYAGGMMLYSIRRFFDYL